MSRLPRHHSKTTNNKLRNLKSLKTFLFFFFALTWGRICIESRNNESRCVILWHSSDAKGKFPFEHLLWVIKVFCLFCFLFLIRSWSRKAGIANSMDECIEAMIHFRTRSYHYDMYDELPWYQTDLDVTVKSLIVSWRFRLTLFSLNSDLTQAVR